MSKEEAFNTLISKRGVPGRVTLEEYRRMFDRLCRALVVLTKCPESEAPERLLRIALAE